MTEHSLWRFSRAFHRAINERQPADLEALLDEDVDWAIYGPIDMFPFLGARHGKAAVLDRKQGDLGSGIMVGPSPIIISTPSPPFVPHSSQSMRVAPRRAKSRLGPVRRSG